MCLTWTILVEARSHFWAGLHMLLFVSSLPLWLFAIGPRPPIKTMNEPHHQSRPGDSATSLSHFSISYPGRSCVFFGIALGPGPRPGLRTSYCRLVRLVWLNKTKTATLVDSRHIACDWALLNRPSPRPNALVTAFAQVKDSIILRPRPATNLF